MPDPIILWYKKTLKKTGKPIMVQQGKGKNMKEYTVDSIKVEGCTIEMSFENSHGSPKSSGASTVLYVYTDKTLEELCK